MVSTGDLPKQIQDDESLELLIKKPQALVETCPIEITTERFPDITKGQKKKKVPSKQHSSSSSLEVAWLKPGISLPKLKRNEVVPPAIDLQRLTVSESFKRSFTEFNSVSETSSASSKVNQRDTAASSVQSFRHVFRSVSDRTSVIASTAVGPSECNQLFRVPFDELTTKEFEPSDEIVDESNALKRWTYWMENKKKLQENLSKRLGRKACDLQIQKLDNYRTMLEDRTVLSYAKIPRPDKWRGHPFYWDPWMKIESKPNEYLDCGGEPMGELHSVKTKLGRGEIPDMEFIGISTAIQKEKGQLCRDGRSPLGLSKKWTEMEYKKEFSKAFETEIKELKPHEVDMSQLAIIGKKIREKHKHSFPTEKIFDACISARRLPLIKVIEPAEKNYTSHNVHASVFCLVIDGVEIKYEADCDHCQNKNEIKVDHNWKIDFGVVNVRQMAERTLRVENRGTMVVKYTWLPHRSVMKQQFLLSLTIKRQDPCFFFDKNCGLFLPGQIYDLKFFLYAKKSGFRKETWQLKTKPPLSQCGEIGKLDIWAVITDDSSEVKSEAMIKYLKKRLSVSTARFIMGMVLKKVFNPREHLRNIEYRSLFLEKDLFQYQNPKHYYHSEIVISLNNFFHEVETEENDWDFSLDSLIKQIMTKVNKEDQDVKLQWVAENARKLLRPNRTFIKGAKKYRMAYGILCKMANLMETDFNYIKKCFYPRRERLFKFWKDGSDLGSPDLVKEDDKRWTVEYTFETDPVRYLRFELIFYMKVYQRLSAAVEGIAGIIETRKFLEPWPKHKAEPYKPPQKNERSFILQ